MIGRATFGCPWIFSRQPLSLDEKIDILEQQLRINIERISASLRPNESPSMAVKRGILHTRRHLAATPLFKGIPNFRPTRIRLLRAETEEEVIVILEDCRRLFR